MDNIDSEDEDYDSDEVAEIRAIAKKMLRKTPLQRARTASLVTNVILSRQLVFLKVVLQPKSTESAVPLSKVLAAPKHEHDIIKGTKLN